MAVALWEPPCPVGKEQVAPPIENPVQGGGHALLYGLVPVVVGAERPVVRGMCRFNRKATTSSRVMGFGMVFVFLSLQGLCVPRPKSFTPAQHGYVPRVAVERPFFSQVAVEVRRPRP